MIIVINRLRMRLVSILLISLLVVNSTAVYIPSVKAQEATGSAQPAPAAAVTEMQATPTAVPTSAPTPTAVVPMPSALPSPVPSIPVAEVASPSAEVSVATPSATPAIPLADAVNLTANILNDNPAANSASLHLKIKMNLLTRSTLQPKESITVELLNAVGTEFKTALTQKDGTEVGFAVKQKVIGDKVVLIIDPPANFKPGQYTLKVTDVLGSSQQLDFQWGVLAINSNKSIYAPGETAGLSMAVLDDKGQMVCDAQIDLKIDNDSLNIHDSLSTKNGSIIVNPECSLHEVTSRPDYEAHYEVGAQGSYKLTMTATAKDRILSIQDTFDVRDSVPFDVERISATRIYPPDVYPVLFRITANQDFAGTIVETVPANFKVTAHPDSGVTSFNETKIEEMSVSGGSVLGVSGVSARIPFDGTYAITQEFGEIADDPFIKKEIADSGLKAHDGVDFAMPEGTEILSMDEGTVAVAGDLIYGKTVVVSHDWGKSYYGHLSKVKVKVGDKIAKGQAIGLSGDTGISTGPHLHLSVLPKGADMENGYFGKVNPLPYIGMTGKSNVLGASDSIYTVKKLIWNINVKKGDKLTLGYQYLAPAVSPQFYLAGPLRFTTENSQQIFEEARQWQIAADNITLAKIRQEINIVDAQVTATGNHNGIITIDTTKYPAGSIYNFEILAKVATGPTTVALRQTGTTTNTASVSVPTSASYTLYRSSFTPITGAITYQLNLSGGTTPNVKAARIVIIEPNLSSLSVQETQIEIGNEELAKANTTAAALTSPKYWYYDSTKWDGTITAAAEVSWLSSVSNASITIILQQDNGSFTWSNLVTIVNAAGSTTATKTRVAFTPTSGRNYRLVASTSNGARTYSIYNAKIVIDQTSTITKFETQYLVGNTLLAAGTALQVFNTSWDPAEWVNTTNVYYHEADSIASGTSNVKLQDISGPTDVTNSATGAISNRARSAAMTMPASAKTVDAIATVNGGNIYDSKIIVQVTVNAPSGNIVISGNVYANETYSTIWTGCGATSNIAISINGGAKTNTTCNASTGYFSFSYASVFAGTNLPIAIFLDTNGGDKGVLYTKNNDTTSDISSLKLVKNEVRVRSESSAAVTKADIAVFDKVNGDSDIPVTAATGTTITFDNSSSQKNTNQGTGDNILTWTHHTGVGYNGILVVSFAGRGAATVTSITYGPSSRTLTFIRGDQNSTDARSELWYLLNPEPGDNTITVHTNINQTITANATTWFGVNQTSPIGNTCGANSNLVSSTSISCSTTLSNTSEVLIDALAAQNASSTMSVPVTQTLRVLYQGWANWAGTSSRTGATGSVAMTWNNNISEYYALSVAALEPAPAAVTLDASTEFHVESSKTFTSAENLILGSGGSVHVDTSGTLDAHTSASPITVPGNVTIETGATLSSTLGTMAISGNFTNNGTFTANTGTVVFNDATQISTLLYAGATSFYNFTVTTAGKEMHFDQAHQTNITNTLNVNGGSCIGLIKLYSNSSPTRWSINATGSSKTVAYADIMDSNAVAAITASNSQSTNNAGLWTITGGACSLTTVNLGGNFYSNETGTAYNCATKNETITLKVNGTGSYTGTCTASSGAYTINNVALHSVGGDVVTAFVSGSTEKAVTIMRSAASPVTLSNLHLYQNRVWLRNDDAGPVTNSDLAFYDSSKSSDIQFTVTAGSLTVSSGNKLVIGSGSTFGPGANVTTPAMEVSGTYSGNNETVTINGSGTGTTCTADAGTVMPLCINSGTFTASVNTVNFTGTAATTIAGTTYYILGVGAAADGNAVTYTLGGNTVIGNVVNVGNSSSSVNDTLAGSTYTLTLGSTFNTKPLNLTSHGLFQADSSTVLYQASTLNVTSAAYYNLNLTSQTATDSSVYVEPLSGYTQTTWDSGATSTGDPFNTSNDVSRTQYIVLASDLRASGIMAGPISRIVMGISQQAGRNLANFQIRMKNTTATTTTSWEGGFTTVLGPITYINMAAGWYYFPLDTTFFWDGVSNLEIDMSRNDTAHTSGGGSYKRTAYGTSRSFTGTCNSCAIASATSGTTSGVAANYVPDIMFYHPETTTLGNGAGETLTVQNNLTIGDSNNAHAVYVDASTNNPAIDVQGNFYTYQNGSLRGSASGSFKIAGNFTNNGGYDPHGGSLEFYNAAKVSTLTYAGNSIFYGFNVSTPSKEIDFDSAHQSIILPSGSLTVNGGDCSTKVKLYSNSSPTQFSLNADATATKSIQYADIKDSNAVNALTATNSQGTNTTNWTITGCGGSPTLDQLMRHGKWFSNGVKQPFTW